jgi:hypothetical protein
LLKAQAARDSEALYRFLEWRYQANCLLQRGGQTYPVAIYPISGPQAEPGRWQTQRDNPNSVLTQRQDLNRLHRVLRADSFLNLDDVELNDDRYRKTLMQAGYFRDPDKNRATFAMSQIHCGETLTMDCYLGNYFDNVDTCDALEWELLNEIHRLKKFDDDSLMAFERSLPLRSELHRRVFNPVRSGAFRCPGIGISTLIVYQDQRGLQLMVKKRSDTTVAAHPGGIHVIPAFMFQPGTSQYAEEFSVTHNVLREYLEELFSVPEPDEKAASARYFYGHGAMVFLRELLDQGEAKIYLSGVAVTLLTLRPEICTLLFIKTKRWWDEQEYAIEEEGSKRKVFRINEEFVDFTSSKEVVGNIAYSDSDSDLLEERALSASRMVPSGAAAFWLGVDVLRDVLKEFPP